LIWSDQRRTTENPSFRSCRRWRLSLRRFRSSRRFQCRESLLSSRISRRCQNGESTNTNRSSLTRASASTRPIRTWDLNGISAAAKIEKSASSGFVFLPRISRIRAETSKGSLENGLAFGTPDSVESLAPGPVAFKVRSQELWSQIRNLECRSRVSRPISLHFLMGASRPKQVLQIVEMSSLWPESSTTSKPLRRAADNPCFYRQRPWFKASSWPFPGSLPSRTRRVF